VQPPCRASQASANVSGSSFTEGTWSDFGTTGGGVTGSPPSSSARSPAASPRFSTSAGATSSSSSSPARSAFTAFLERHDIRPVAPHLIGPDRDDLAYLHDVEQDGLFAPTATILVLNEALVPARRAIRTAFQATILERTRGRGGSAPHRHSGLSLRAISKMTSALVASRPARKRAVSESAASRAAVSVWRMPATCSGPHGTTAPFEQRDRRILDRLVHEVPRDVRPFVVGGDLAGIVQRPALPHLLALSNVAGDQP